MADTTYEIQLAFLQEHMARLTEENNRLQSEITGLEKWKLLDQAGDAILLSTIDGVIVDVNASFCSYINEKKENVIQRKLEDFVPKDKVYKLKRLRILLQETGRAKGILPISHNKGTTFFETVTTVDSSGELFISVMRDITHKMIMEEKVKGKEKLIKELFLEAIDGIIFWDVEGNVINANLAACRIFDIQHNELLGRNFTEFIPNKDDHFFVIMHEIRETGAVNNELWLRMPNGKDKLIEFSSKLHSVEGYHMTIFRDATARFQMEKELRESESKCRKVFEGTLDGMILWDDKNAIIDINSAAEELFGVSRHLVVGKKIQEFVLCPEQRGELEHHIHQMIEIGQQHSTISFTREDGTVKHYEYTTKHHLSEEMNLTVVTDVTERNELQAQLKKSDTLNVIGELAAGIAHEIRNPMTALKGFIQLLKGSIKKEHEMYYQVITSELQRIESIITEFLILAKPQAIRYQETDLTKIMKETVDLLGAQAVLHNVQFSESLDSNLPPIYGEPNQLKKVFINIIKNAIEVMPSGGTIDIKMERMEDEKIHIRIRDEGIGISPERLKKLGEPFYTTKERGTGLGLMVSYRIIGEHHGTIKVESEEGVGTTFHIYLPFQINKEKISSEMIHM